MLRRGRRKLLPMAESLEGRTLLSVGLDPTYGFGGVSELNVPPNTATTTYFQSIGSIALQSGKVVAVGETTAQGSGSDVTSLNVWRLNTDGTLDASFGSSGMQTIPTSAGGVTYTIDTAADIAVQSSGSIDVLALVTPTSPAGSEEYLVAQLTATGALDTSFGNSGIALVRNSPIAFFTTTGWFDTRVMSMPSGRSAMLEIELLFHILAEHQNIAAVAHSDCQADRWLTIHPEHRLRRIGQRAVHHGDVAQANQTPVRRKIDVEEIFFGNEGTGHADRQLLVACLKRARRNYSVLRLKCSNQCGAVDPETRELTDENST